MTMSKKVVEYLEELQMFELDTSFVDLVSGSEFTEEQDPELTINASSLVLLKKCIPLLQEMIKTKSMESIWSLLVEKKLPLKHIQVWIFSVLLIGQKASATYAEKDACILTANLYYLLLALGGSNRESFFHCIIFEKAVETFSTCGILNKHPLKRKADNIFSQQKKKSRQNSSQNPSQNSDDVIEADLTNEEIDNILENTVGCVFSFNFLLHSMALREQKVSFMHALRGLLKLISCFGRTMTSDIKQFNFNSELSAFFNAGDDVIRSTYHGIYLLADPKHGSIEQTSLTLLKRLLPICIMHESVSFNAVPKAYIYSSTTCFNFILELFKVINNAEVLANLRSFLQNLVAQNPDRAEYRTHMAEGVSRLILQMPYPFYQEFTEWLSRTLKHAKVAYRSNALIVIGQLLCLPEHKDKEYNPETKISHTYLLQFIMQRLVDITASVRSRALGVIVEVMQNKIVTPDTLREAANTCDILLSVVTEIKDRPNENIIDRGGVFAVILSHCAEWNKSQVRKSALSAIENALIINYLPVCHANMLILEERCRDPALMVRKQSIQSLTNVLMKFSGQFESYSSWVRGIFPRVLDPETTVQEKVVACVEKILFRGLQSEVEEDNIIAWNILDYFTAPESNGNKIFLENLCSQWFKQNKSETAVCDIVLKYLNSGSRRTASWLFIEILTRNTCNKNIAMAIHEGYKSQADTIMFLPLHKNMICTLGNAAKYFSSSARNELINELKESIETFMWPIQLTTNTMETIQSLVSSTTGDDSVISEEFHEWCLYLLNKCEQFVSNIFKAISENQIVGQQTVLLINYLTVGGCASLYNPKQTPKRLLLYMQALLTGTDDQVDIHCSQLTQGTQPLSQFKSKSVPDNVKAHVILNLGKMSFFKSNLAKKLVPAMVRELETSKSEMVRSNVLIVLTDLCILQTQLVDPYISEMATSLQDESPAVRKHAVTLLSKLLRKEFVKWKGSLLFKYLACTCDNDPEIQALAKFSLLEQLLTKNAGEMFFRHFIQAVFYLNSCEHAKYNRFVKSDREIRLFDFSSKKRASKRMTIYKMMLEEMVDDFRIKLTSKLCEDILGAVVDGAIPLNSKTENILKDVLEILCCKEIKLKCLQTSTDEDDLEDIQPMQQRNTERVQQEIKKGFVTQVVKRNLVENIIPIIISLKNLLTDKRSQLTANIMVFLKEVMQDYKTEVQDILACDKQLAAEIEFDIKRFDRLQQEKEERALLEKQKQLQLNTPTTPARPNIRAPVFFTPSRTLSAGSKSRRKTVGSFTKWTDNQTPVTRRRTLSSRELLISAQNTLRKMKLKDKIDIDERRNAAAEQERVNDAGEISGNNQGKENDRQPITNNDGGSERASAFNTQSQPIETESILGGREVSTPEKQSHLSITFSQDYSRILSPINYQK